MRYECDLESLHGTRILIVRRQHCPRAVLPHQKPGIRKLEAYPGPLAGTSCVLHSNAIDTPTL